MCVERSRRVVPFSSPALGSLFLLLLSACKLMLVLLCCLARVCSWWLGGPNRCLSNLCLSLLAVEQISFYADLGNGVRMPLMKFLKPLEMVRPCAGDLFYNRGPQGGRESASSAQSHANDAQRARGKAKQRKSVMRRAPRGMPCGRAGAVLSLPRLAVGQKLLDQPAVSTACLGRDEWEAWAARAAVSGSERVTLACRVNAESKTLCRCALSCAHCDWACA